MKMNLRVRLLGTIIGAILLFFVFSVVAARLTLGRDLNELGRSEVKSGGQAFDGYWTSHRDQVKLLVTQDAASDSLRKLVAAHDTKTLQDQLGNIARTTGFSFLTVVDAHGRVLARANNASLGTLATNKFVQRALTGETVSTAALLASSELAPEGLADQATSTVKDASGASTGTLDSGLALIAAAPVTDLNERTIGAVYGGILMNHSLDIVDAAKAALGGSTALLDGNAIVASTIKLPDGTIAADLAVPAYDTSVKSGTSFTGVQTVGGTEYLSRMEPIKTDQGDIIGALWYGIPLSQITSIINNTTWSLVLWGLVAMIVALTLAIPIVGRLSDALGRRSRQVRSAAKDLGVAIVGSEVSGDHVSQTRATVERSGALIDDLAKGATDPKIAELKSLNDELQGDIIVIDTLSQEMASRMKDAVTRVHELNDVAAGLNKLVSGDTE